MTLTFPSRQIKKKIVANEFYILNEEKKNMSHNTCATFSFGDLIWPDPDFNLVKCYPFT